MQSFNPGVGRLIRGIIAVGIVAVVGAFSACASSEEGLGPTPTVNGKSGSAGRDSGPDTTTGGTGFGGSGGGTGATGGTGTSGTGATGGGADAAPTCIPADGQVVDPTLFPVCPLCPGAHCVPTAAVPANVAGQLADCPEGDGSTGDAAAESGTSSGDSSAPSAKCVPDTLIASGGQFILPTCRSLIDAEGRCLSICVPQVASQADRLPQSTCGTNELCAPCYDPTTGAATGACTAGCDTGPKEAPKTFATCCSGIGSCVPTSLVPAAQLSQLGPDTCTDTGTVCAPTELVNPSFIPATCQSLEVLPGQYAEGRCLADCLPAVASQLSRLPVSTCSPNHHCAPCFDPITGAATGACTLNGDQPTTQTALVFASCCNGHGLCVPKTAVPTSQQSQLSQDTCTDADYLCAPKELIDPNSKPATCRSLNNSEGRCLETCLPQIASQADRLPQSTCQTGYLCAPCYDPVSETSTGACTLNGDAPTESATANAYQRCCGTLGACVPKTLIPAAQQPMLASDVCTDPATLCVPISFAGTTGTGPKVCSSLEVLPGQFAEGRCVPTCVPQVQQQADRLPQDVCQTGEKCAPCYNPIDGSATGSCTVGTDQPTKPALKFTTCCTGNGLCVSPTEAGSQASSLVAQECTGGFLCAPIYKVANTTPVSCDPMGLFAGQPGVCVAACFVTGLNGIFTVQSSCQTGEKCAPCSVFGSATGAC